MSMGKQASPEQSRMGCPFYQYSVYGEAAVEEANHTNPYMFVGPRYDIEIDLYTTVRGTIIRSCAVSCRPTQSRTMPA